MLTFHDPCDDHQLSFQIKFPFPTKGYEDVLVKEKEVEKLELLEQHKDETLQ